MSANFTHRNLWRYPCKGLLPLHDLQRTLERVKFHWTISLSDFMNICVNDSRNETCGERLDGEANNTNIFTALLWTRQKCLYPIDVICTEFQLTIAFLIFHYAQRATMWTRKFYSVIFAIWIFNLSPCVSNSNCTGYISLSICWALEKELGGEENLSYKFCRPSSSNHPTNQPANQPYGSRTRRFDAADTKAHPFGPGSCVTLVRLSSS
jgi:hypothetical protein